MVAEDNDSGARTYLLLLDRQRGLAARHRRSEHEERELAEVTDELAAMVERAWARQFPGGW